MSIVVVGSVALDTVETPFGKERDALGGTAVYFSIAASHFTSVNVVGVVGDDFPAEHITMLQGSGCDLDGLQTIAGRTFRWVGRYDQNMNVAHTLDTQLNVFEAFSPEIPLHYRSANTLFLGNIAPELQLDVLDQMDRPRLVGLDTMNYWISGKRAALEHVMRRVDVVLINEDEARQFAGEYRIMDAARFIMACGPRIVVIKRGEYGAALFTTNLYAALPAYPSGAVMDTTGAGDSFAGGFLGYLDMCEEINEANLRRAIAYGTVVASFTVEDFSVRALQRITQVSIRERFEALRAISAVEPAEIAIR